MAELSNRAIYYINKHVNCCLLNVYSSSALLDICIKQLNKDLSFADGIGHYIYIFIYALTSDDFNKKEISLSGVTKNDELSKKIQKIEQIISIINSKKEKLLGILTQKINKLAEYDNIEQKQIQIQIQAEEYELYLLCVENILSTNNLFGDWLSFVEYSKDVCRINSALTIRSYIIDVVLYYYNCIKPKKSHTENQLEIISLVNDAFYYRNFYYLLIARKFVPSIKNKKIKLATDGDFSICEEIIKTMHIDLVAHLNKVMYPSDNEDNQLFINSITGSRPILHKEIYDLLPKFIGIKKAHGTEVEKKLYKNMTVNELVDRLIYKRPLTFMRYDDYYRLRNGASGSGNSGRDLFGNIVTASETNDINLNDYISYDEMQLAAFIGFSGPTVFLNNGDRKNKGVAGDKDTYEKTGIIVGLVGARFERIDKMEARHMFVSEYYDPNSSELQKMWAEFYGYENGLFPVYDSVSNNDTNYISTQLGYLNIAAYKKRMKITISTFLHEAVYHAKLTGKKACCNIVGLGLGMWMVDPGQNQIFYDVVMQVIDEDRGITTEYISDINFNYFPSVNERKPLDANKRINININKKGEFAGKLKCADKILVTMFAWDSNSYVGNEFWIGSLDASGDPAAACCSTIAYTLNPIYNPNICAENLFILPSGEIVD